MPSNWPARATWLRASSTKWRARSPATRRSISRAKKQAVRNAIEIYENEIAGRPSETNFGAIVETALTKARAQVDKGQSAFARATLDKAAQDMAREEKKRRERYVASVTVLRHRERDIALATYDGDAAAAAIAKLARSIHAANAPMIGKFLSKEARALHEYGRDRGSNVHLVAAIASNWRSLRRMTSAAPRATISATRLRCSASGERDGAA